MSVQLEIAYDGGQATFGPDQILNSDLVVGESVREQGVESSDLKVVTTDMVAGYDFYDLPPTLTGGYYRAQLIEEGASSPITQGVVFPASIDYDDKTKTYAWTILGALEEAWRRLDEVRLRNLDPATLTDVDVDTHKQRKSTLAGDTKETTGYAQRVRPWYPIGELTGPVTGAARDLADQTDTFLYEYVVQYDDGGTIKRYTPETQLYLFGPLPPGDSATGGQEADDLWQNVVGPFLPPWTGKRFFEVLLSLAGWRLTASFGAFPDDTITLDNYRLEWDETATPLFGLDSDQTSEAFGLLREDADRIGIQYANDIGEKSPEQRPTQWPDPSASAEPELHAPMPAPAVYAPTTWTPDEATGQEEDPRQDSDATSVDLRLPAVLHEPSKTLTHSPAAGYDEEVKYGWPVVGNEPGSAYIAHVDDGLASDPFIVHHRRAINPGPDQREYHGREWAPALYKNRGWSFQGQVVLEGTYSRAPGAGLAQSTQPVTGDPASQVSANGRQWAIRLRRDDLISSTTEVELARPDDAPSTPALAPALGQPQNTESRVIEIDVLEVSGTQQHAVVQWAPPPSAEANAFEYEVEHSFNGGGFQSYELAPVISTFVVIRVEEVYQKMDETDVLSVRVRANGVIGGTSSWANHKVQLVN
jgi:hypothetical protein